MSDPTNPARDDPVELIDLGLHIAFQAKLAGPRSVARGPVISRIESEGRQITDLVLQQPLGERSPPPQPLSLTGVPAGVGKYQVLGELGRGGLGVVLKARDMDLGRDTAMKVLIDQRERSPEAIQRFVEEAQVAGQLQHPGIVPVYEMGLFPDSSPYFTMKLVNGQTFAALLKARTDASEERMRFLGIFEQVCQAVAYAHSRGVVHRDLKPSNIMVGAFGEVQVMDWGLSKVLGRGPAAVEPAVETIRSRSVGSDSLQGTVMGTPAYMPPEQARGEVALMDESSDVFSLGAMLCEALTGEPPYVGESPKQVCLLASSAALEPAWARLDASGSDDDLVRIAKQCLSAKPADRPRDAGVVAGEIRAYLSSVEERARASELAKARALARAASERKARRLTVALAVFILAALSLAGGAYLVVEKDRLSREEITARAVEDALEESTLLLGQARSASTDEVSRWSEALQAAKRAASLVATGAAREQLRTRVNTLLDETVRGEELSRRTAEQNLANRKFLERLEEIRLSRADPGVANWKKQDEDYGDAFRSHGLDIDAATPEAAAESIRQSLIRTDLIPALDEWIRARMSRDELPRDSWKKLSRVAAASDPDPWRAQLRELAYSGRFEEIRAFAHDPMVPGLSASSACLLAAWLNLAGDGEAAITVCRTAVERHPEDFWLNTTLGIWLLQSKSPDANASSRYLTAAVALRPKASRAWNNLGCALTRLKDVDGSISAYRQALQLDPGSYHALNNLGSMLIDKGELDDAISLLRDSVKVGPDYAEGRMNLGIALEKKGSVDEAAECYRRASGAGSQGVMAFARLALLLEARGDLDGAIDAYGGYIEKRPLDAKAHLGRGILLARKKRLDEAIPELREAVRLKPDLADAHSNLGTALLANGDLRGSIASLQEAVRIDPLFAEAYSNLSAAFERSGDTKGAMAACREAVRIKPEYAQGHFNLGVCLEKVGDKPGALACFKEAGRLMPEFGDAHLAHGRLLEQRGLYTEALEAYRKADQWSQQHSSLRRKYEDKVRACERRIGLASRLEEILQGKSAAASGEESIELAEICYSKGLYRDAVKLWQSAFQADADLARSIESGNRYAAACAATLAGCAQRENPLEADDAPARRIYRLQALEWLRQDLARIKGSTRESDAERKALAEMVLDRRNDPDFACVQSGEGLGQLEKAEREAWRELWAEADRLLVELGSPSAQDPSK